MNRIVILLIAGLLGAGCTTSVITHAWKADNPPQKKFENLLVICIGNNNVSLEESMEAHLADDLRIHQINASSAHEVLGPKLFTNLNEKEVLEKIEKSGYDAVLTIVLLDKEKEKYYVPGKVRYSPYIVYHRRFWGYYSTIYERIYEPGYYAEKTNYFWESNLYDMRTKQLIYSVQTKSFDPLSPASVSHEYGKLICQNMIDQHVIR